MTSPGADGASGAADPRRKVLHITSHFGRPGRNLWLHRLLCSFHRWEPHLLTATPPDLEEALAGYPWPRSQLTFLPDPSPLGRLAGAICREVTWVLWGRTRSPSSRLIQRLHREHRFDLIHLHRSRFWDDAQGISVPRVASFYGGDVMRRHGGRRTRRLGRILRQASAIVVTSQALRGRVEELGAPADRLRVVPVGIDPGDFPPAAEVEERRKQTIRGDLQIVTVGRLVEVKAPDALPQVARTLLDRGLSFRWTLVGEGPLRARIQERARHLGVMDRFRLVGSQPFRKVQDLLWDADLMVHNAVVMPDGGRESLGVALMEAGAMGLPVVSCRVGGIPEVVVDGETGRLVAEGDLEGMARSILEVGRDPKQRQRMALATLRRARTLFDSQRLTAELEGVYDALVGGGGDEPSPSQTPDEVSGGRSGDEHARGS